MDTLRIQTLEARYHLPPSAADQRHRLDRLLPEAVGPALELILEQALEEQGIGREEELCLREVRVPVRLGPGAGDGAVVLTWSEALAAGIARAVRDGGPGVVRYRSRRQALVDLVRGVARGDHRRGWAWRQLGFGDLGPTTPPAAATAVAIRALAAEDDGAAVVPVLAALAADGDLPALARRLDPGWWPELAAAALVAAGWPVAVLEETAGETEPGPAAGGPPAEPSGPLPGDPGSAAGPGLRRALARSPLATALGALLRSLPAELDRHPRTVSALAALALLDADPAPPVDRSALVRRLASTAGRLTDPGSEGAGREGRAGVASAVAGREGAGEKSIGEESAGNEKAAAARSPASPSGPSGATPSSAPSPSAEPGDDLPLVPRREGLTAWGGLLFLVGLAEDLGLPEAVAGHPVLAARPFRTALHRLALELVPAAPDDPAVLAFAGLPPGSEPPSEGDGPWEEGETAALRALAGTLAAGLAERLGDRSIGPSEAAAGAVGEPEALLQRDCLRRVCRRRARLVADPGWIDVHLSLADVSTGLRRAGLDLDPGWVPWLGVVLRFRYE